MSTTPETIAIATAVAGEILSAETGGFSGRPHSHGAVPIPGDSRGERTTSFEMSDFPVPTGREEEWRFTPLDRLRHLHEDEVAGDGTVHVEVDAAPEVEVETVARGDTRLGRGGRPADRVAARAWNAFEKATVITVPKDTVASRPTTVALRGDGGTAFGHILVDVQPFAQAVVVLDHTGSATYADNVEFVVADGASLTVVAVNDWADDAVHVSQQSVAVGRDGRYRSIGVVFGADLA
ncbi:MAG: SufD family Fe-S cluster assembly protein, partial [Actinomycetes bacterium]